MRVDTILKKFSISYNNNNYEIGARFLDILINYFTNNQFLKNSNSLKNWIDTILLLKENYKSGNIYMSIYMDNEYYRDCNEAFVEITLNDVNLKKKTIENYDDYKISNYWHNYNYKRKEFISQLRITDKLNVATLRRLLFEKFFRDEKIYNHIYKIKYNSSIQIIKEIEENEENIINISTECGYNSYNSNYYSYYEFKINSDFENKYLENLYPKYLVKKKRWKERFNKINELVENFLKKENITPFKAIKEAIKLNNTLHIMKFLI